MNTQIIVGQIKTMELSPRAHDPLSNEELHKIGQTKEIISIHFKPNGFAPIHVSPKGHATNIIKLCFKELSIHFSKV